MADPHVVTALVAKRAELAGRIEHAQRELRKLVIDLDSIDSALRIFDPEIDAQGIRAKPVPTAHHAFRGEVTRIVLDTLRIAKGGPVTSREIALKVMAGRGLVPGDAGLERLIVKRVGACLRQLRRKGLVKEELIAGKYMNWRASSGS
jgi:hypothetical protein